MEPPRGAPPGAYLMTWDLYQLFVLLFALVAEFDGRLTSTDTSSDGSSALDDIDEEHPPDTQPQIADVHVDDAQDNQPAALSLFHHHSHPLDGENPNAAAVTIIEKTVNDLLAAKWSVSPWWVQ